MLLLPLARLSIFVRRRSEVEYASIDIWALMDVVCTAMCGLLILHHYKKINFSGFRKNGMSLLLGYYLFSVCSFLWKLPGTSTPYIIYRAGCMTIMLLYAYFFITRFESKRQAFQALVNYLSIILCFSVYPSLISGSFHTNTYSFIAALVLAMTVMAYKQGLFSWKEISPYLILSAICLAIGTSAGSNVSFLCALLFIFSVNKRYFSFGRFFVCIILILLIWECAYEPFAHLLFPNKNINNLHAMTGRTKIWEVYLNAWATRPWLGLGFSVGERSGSYFGYVYTLSTHNGFLSIIVNTGIIGCVFWVLFLFRFCRELFVNVTKGSPYSMAVAAACVVIFVNNNTVPIIGSYYSPLSMSALLVLAFFSFWEMGDNDKSQHLVKKSF